MATKLYDTALDFMPDAKPAKTGRGILGTAKIIIEAFADARNASARYDSLVNRGVPASKAARMAFDTVYEQR